jgi:hypothetical protein
MFSLLRVKCKLAGVNCKLDGVNSGTFQRDLEMVNWDLQIYVSSCSALYVMFSFLRVNCTLDGVNSGTFQRDLEMVNWDLQKWRNKFTGPQWDFTLLDMNGARFCIIMLY